MFAVIRTGGKQYVVSPETKLKIEKVSPDSSTGSGQAGKVVFDEVLLFADGEKVEVGKPTIKDAEVVGKVVGEGRRKKIIILKYKPKKRYKKKMGHRQFYSEVEITSIGKSKPEAPAKKTTAKKQST